MFKQIKLVLGTAIFKQTEKVIARAYVRQCEKLADGDEIKFNDYLKPSMLPICLFTSITEEKDDIVLDGEFVCVRNEFDEEWVLTFDDYVHANEMAEQYLEIAGHKVEARKTPAPYIFTHSAPIMGASMCKTDGTVVETPSTVYRAIYKDIVTSERFKQARANELKKRMEKENGS
jgi:hypothetical protein